jgi:hypothetical protein
VSSLLDEFSVAEYLQEDEAPANRDTPQHEYGTEEVEAGVFAGLRIVCHGSRRWSLVVSR